MHVDRQLIAVEAQETLTKHRTKNTLFACRVSIIFVYIPAAPKFPTDWQH